MGGEGGEEERRASSSSRIPIQARVKDIALDGRLRGNGARLGL